MGKQRQHLIPKFYLTPFLSPGWVYRKGKDAAAFYKNAKSVAISKDYYGKSESDKEAIDLLNCLVEESGAPALRKLINKPNKIDGSDWFSLSLLFANMAVRPRALIEQYSAEYLQLTEQLNAMVESMTARIEENISEGKDVPTFDPHIDDSSPRFTLGDFNEAASKLRAKGGHIHMAEDLFCVIPDIAKYIRGMTFCIYKAAPGELFLTSDRPLYLQRWRTRSPVGAAWGKADALGLIALDPTHFLTMMYYEKPQIRCHTVSPIAAEEFNLETIAFAYKEVYSPFEYSKAHDWMTGNRH